MKAVVDRIVQYANRYQLTNVETGEVLGTFDFEEVTGTVQQVGTEIDKELFDSIANDLAARVKLSGGELAGTIVTFSDIRGTAENVASGDTSATLWGKVRNWFSRLRALAFKNKVAAGDFEAGAIKDADVSSSAAIAQGKISGLTTDYVASISVSGRTLTFKNKGGATMGTATTQDTTYGLASQSSNGLMSSTDKTKLDGIESGAQKNTVLGVKGGSESAYRTGNVNITKANIGLGNVDNTSDADKPVSTAMQTALNGKANTSGTYPNLTVGKATNAATATNAETATARPATHVLNGADLNDYRGSAYWGKTFYAGGNNTVQNLPYTNGAGFNLEIIRAGSYSTIQRLSSIISGGSPEQPTVYTRSVVDTATEASGTWTEWQESAEANGTYPDMTVGKAKSLAKTGTVSTAINSAQYGWWRFARIPFSTLNAMTGTGSYSAILLVNSINPTGIDSIRSTQSGIIELDLRLDGGKPTSIGTNAVMKILCGGLSSDMFCCTVNDTEIEFYVNLNAAYNRRSFTVLNEVYFDGTHIDALELKSTFVSSSAPSGAVYAVVRNNASGDGNGNGLMSHATRNELLNGASSYDFNDYIEWGHYELQGTSGTSLVNAPTSTSNPSATNADWYLDVYRRDNTYVTQIAYSARSDGAIATRVLSNNSWGGWRVVIDSGIVPNAANATHATSADRATNATHATSADRATNATHATSADRATNLSGLISYRSTINLSSGKVTSDSVKYMLSLLSFFGGACIGANASVDDGRATSFLIGRNAQNEVIAIFDENNNGVRFDANGAYEYGSFNMSGELTLNIVVLI